MKLEDPGDPGIIGVELQRRSGQKNITRVTVNISKM